MFKLPPPSSLVIKSEADFDPWQAYQYSGHVVPPGFMRWTWCKTNQSGKDEYVKVEEEKRLGG